jgi:hypothetical protein
MICSVKTIRYLYFFQLKENWKIKVLGTPCVRHE